jgi:hypothetical protein
VKGKISLDAYEVIIVDPEEVGKEFCFMLTHAHKRVYYFSWYTINLLSPIYTKIIM